MLPSRRLPIIFLFLALFYSLLTLAQGKSGKEKNTELTISPNPAKAFTKFKLKLKKNDVVTLEIFDSKGKSITKVYNKETLGKGNKPEKQFNRPKKEGETYTCVLTTVEDGQSTLFLVFDEVLSTEVLSPESGSVLQIAPNPTSGFVQIASPGRPVTSIKVHDMIGNTVLNESVDFSELHKIDLSHLHPGIYFLTLRRKDDTDIIRIVKTE